MSPATPLMEWMPLRIPASAVGPHRKLALPQLIRLFQEAAMQNTIRLGISSADLIRSHGLTWVLHRQVVEVEEWPELGQAVKVATVPTRIERNLITYRDFYLHDEAGAVMVRSTSAWSLMHQVDRRIKSIPTAISRRLNDLPPRESHLPFPKKKLLPPPPGGTERSFRVAFAQLDFNNHLTNPAYPEMMLEPLGLNHLAHHLPVHVDIAYHREARYGDPVTAYAQPTGEKATFVHALYRAEEELLATMKTRWVPLT